MSAILFQQWLNSGQDYAAGVALYASHGTNGTLARTLQSCPASPYLAKRLNAEIAALAASLPLIGPVVVPAAEAGAESTGNAAVDDLVRERIALFKTASHLHGRLELLEQADRRDAAFEIKRLFRRIDAIWEALAYQQEHGHLPPTAPVAPDLVHDVAALVRRRNNLRTYVAPGRRARYSAEQLAGFRIELKELERRCADA